MRSIKTFIMPLFLVVVCGLLLRSAYVEVKNRAVDQLNNQQLIMADTAARGIESFFEHYTGLLTQLAETKGIASVNDDGIHLMQTLYRAHESEVKGITRVSASGRIIYTFPERPEAVGADISSQKHIREIMRTHQPVISDVFGSVQGFVTIAVHVPIFENGVFAGSLALLVAFDQLSRHYLEPIKIGRGGYAWIISGTGVELYCPVPGHIGRSVFENCKGFPALLAMAREMVKGNRGTTTYSFDRVRDDYVAPMNKHAVYVPVHIGNTFWSIAVATPDDEVLEVIRGFRDRWFLIIGVLMLTTIVWTSYVFSAFKIVKEEEKRKQAETALKESEEKYRELVESANSIILRRDVSGRVTFLNGFAQRFFGYSEEEILGKNVIGTIVPEIESTGRDLRLMIKDIATNPDGYISNVNENVCRDGKRVWVAWANKPILDNNGKVVEILCIGNDITGRKRAEEEKEKLEERLQRAEKMEALGTMAGGVAHDLNNVLGIVVGYSEMLLFDLGEPSPGRSRAMEVLKAGQRAAAIVQDLLTLARRGVPSRRILNLNNILMECMKSPEFESLCSFHPKVQIKTDFEPDLLNIAGSSVHLGKTFMNLVSNAAEAMSDGGIIAVKTRNQYLDKPVRGYDEVKEGDHVVLSVSDCGEGIPASDLKRIFEPFYTKKIMGRSGTGLGLAVVWGTVKDHSGHINVESEEGKGTTFSLYFPVTREELTPENISASVPEYMGNGESILVVDDVQEQRDLATAMLKKLNYRVITVASGEKAVEYLTRNSVHLVVLDMVLDPGIDGLETYTRILEINPGQKAIIVSGFAETERVSKVQSLGAGAYVKKPYVLEKLGMAVRKELDRPA